MPDPSPAKTAALSISHQPSEVAADHGPRPEKRGFGSATASAGSRRKSNSKRRPALSKSDWGPLGKHPDLEAIVARQRLHLPLSGRLSAAAVNQAWKRCAADHHPDRGGCHDTMQQVNGARDLLLGRDASQQAHR